MDESIVFVFRRGTTEIAFAQRGAHVRAGQLQNRGRRRRGIVENEKTPNVIFARFVCPTVLIVVVVVVRTLQRTFSGRNVEEPAKGKFKRGGDFSYTNQSFSSLPEDFQIRGSENDANPTSSKTPTGENIFCPYH